MENTLIFLASVTLLIGSGVAVAMIDKKYKPREKALERQRNSYLWKFELNSQKDQEEMLLIDTWSIRKLWFAGCMISMTIISVTVKRIGRHSLSVGGVFLLLWTFVLAYFWYLEVMLKYKMNDAISSEAKSWQNMNHTTIDTSDLAINYNPDAPPFEISKVIKDANSVEISNISPPRTVQGKANALRNTRNDNRLPVTIITGFLGSGKTTVIKNILNNTVGIRILVIENEIGEEGIDHDLLFQQTEKEDIILLNNGCVCCTVRKDLLTTFDELFKDEALFEKLDWVVIETTGLADPAPLIQTLYMDRICQSRLRLDSVLTVVDAKHFSEHVVVPSDEVKNESITSVLGGLLHTNNKQSEAVQQVIYADRILLNKIDLVNPSELENVKTIISKINVDADILVCKHGDLDTECLLNIRAFDPLKNIALINPPPTEAAPVFAIPLDDKGKIPLKQMTLGVQPTPPNPFSSISLTTSDPLDLTEVNKWLTTLLEVHGTNIYRLKGILSINGYDEMFVAHGIHMIFDGQRGIKWDEDEVRQSRMVIIGKNLNEMDLKNQFLRCIAPASAIEAKKPLKAIQTDFTKLEIRVGRIIKAEEHKKATSLACLEVDVAEKKKRSIVAQLRPKYSTSDLKGRLVLVLCNVKEVDVGGVPSSGSIILAFSDNGKGSKNIELVEPPAKSEVGERVFLDELGSFPPTKIRKTDLWEVVKMDMRTNDSKCVDWKGSVLKTSKGPCKVASLVNAQIM